MNAKGIVEIIMPYLSLTIALIFMFTAVVVISHILIWGLLLGSILFVFVQLKNWFMPHPRNPITMTQHGRIFEHE